jgi:hypothetical protein
VLAIVETHSDTCQIGHMTITPIRQRDLSQLANMMVDIASGAVEIDNDEKTLSPAESSQRRLKTKPMPLLFM